jgi:MFS family permease
LYKALYFIITIAFLDMFVQFPIMSPFAKSLGANAFMIGLIMGGYSLTNLFGNVLAGLWIDSFGARRMLGIGMVLTGIVTGMYILVDSPGQLLLIRLIHGFTSGFLAPSAFTLISNKANHEGKQQGRNMALSGASVGIAAIIGPAMAGILKAQLGVNAVFQTVAIIMIIGAAITWFIIREERITMDWKPGSVKASDSWLVLLRNRHIAPSYLGAFSLMFTMGILTYMLPLKADELQLKEQTAGLLLSTFGIVAILFFVLPTNRIFDRFKVRHILGVGFICLAAALWSLFFASTLHLMYVSMGIYGLGFALVFPSMTKNIADHVLPHNRGKAFGLFYSIYSIGVVCGSVLVGIIASNPNEGFLLAASFMTVFCFILWNSNIKGGDIL